MKRYILRFYRKFFSRKGRQSIKKLVYFGIIFWFLSFSVQWFIYSEYMLKEWYYFYLIYCLFFYLGIMFLPWTRYTLLFKLRIFYVFSCVSAFMITITLISLYSFFILNQKPCTAYPVYQVLLSIAYHIIK